MATTRWQDFGAQDQRPDLEGFMPRRIGTDYCVGFAFTHDQKVTLLMKARPAWQNGLLNGIGGKLNPGEVSREAMVREFFEETGLVVPAERWTLFHREAWPNGNSVSFFTCLLAPDEDPKTMDPGEPVSVYHWRHRRYDDWQGFIYNLSYLIPMAFTHLTGNPADIPAHRD
jgi:8-oxo-dGTP diphosphatase